MNKAHESHIKDTVMRQTKEVMQEEGCTQREVPILNREVTDRMTEKVGSEQQLWRRGQWAVGSGAVGSLFQMGGTCVTCVTCAAQKRQRPCG